MPSFSAFLKKNTKEILSNEPLIDKTSNLQTHKFLFLYSDS